MNSLELHEDCVYCGTDAEAPARNRRHELTEKGLEGPLSRAEANELRQLLLPAIEAALASAHGTDQFSRMECDGLAVALRDVEVVG